MTRAAPWEAITAHAEASETAHPRHELTRQFSRHALDAALTRGTVVRILPGIYLAARHSRSFAARCDAALLWAGDRALLAGASAAHLHGLLPQPPATVAVVVDPRTHLRPPTWIRVLRPTVLPLASKARGFAVVSVIDALLGAWGELPRDQAQSGVIDAVRDGRATTANLLARAGQLPRVSGRHALEALVRSLDGGVDSYLEHLASTRVFNLAEFAGFARQATVRAGNRRYILDMFDADARVAVELDGRRYHGDDSARRRDLARDADLAARGITTIRLTFEDVNGRPDWCRDRVRRAVRARRDAGDVRGRRSTRAA